MLQLDKYRSIVGGTLTAELALRSALRQQLALSLLVRSVKILLDQP